MKSTENSPKEVGKGSSDNPILFRRPRGKRSLPMLRSAALVLSGNALSALLLLARNLLIARIVPVEDYGVAVTFLMAMALVEMMSQLGLQQQIIQSSDGDHANFQNTVQALHVLRGIVSGGLLLCFAHPIANFLRIPQAAWAYQVMAVVPVLYGLIHFDIYRVNRRMVFWPSVLSITVPAVLALIAVWPLFTVFGDYRVMLYSMVIQAIAVVLISHVVATRSYRLALDLTVVRGALNFGWPLLVNGILMFAVFNGDKAIVGREIGMPALTIFAMGFTLTLTPALILSKTQQSLLLPQLSNARQDPDLFQTLSLLSLQTGLFVGLAFAVGVALVGKPIVFLLLGEKFLNLLSILVPLAVLHAIMAAKAGPTSIALACGHTTNPTISNVPRALCLPLCWIVAVQTDNLMLIIWIVLAGELIGYLVSLVLISWQSGVQLMPMTMPILIGSVLLVLICVNDQFGSLEHSPQFGSPLDFALYLILLGLCALKMSELHRFLHNR